MLQTAVVSLPGNQELHLAAMGGGGGEKPGFWVYLVQRGAYQACLRMLNACRLALVFDLDETLVVARSVKNFRDEVAKLEGVLEAETDPGRRKSLLAERLKIEEDYALLKQFAEKDRVSVDGRDVSPEREEGLLDGDVDQAVLRQVIRMPERDTIITRIFPDVRQQESLETWLIMEIMYWNDPWDGE